jgi:hypothetical protein
MGILPARIDYSIPWAGVNLLGEGRLKAVSEIGDTLG